MLGSWLLELGCDDAMRWLMLTTNHSLLQTTLIFFSAMELVLVKSLWGVPASSGTSGWEEMFAQIARDGFGAVETISLVWEQDTELFKSLLTKNNLKFIAQIHTAGGYMRDSNYVYCSSYNVNEHAESFRTQVQSALSLNPALINVHSGHDMWESEKILAYFEQVLAIEKEIVPSTTTLVHETHRQRLLFNPSQTLEILSNPKLSGLKLNADLSHWACVCERLFEDESRDPWWPPLLQMVAERCHFIHARVGHSEGPQVFDPREGALFSAEISAHLKWWEAIWKNQYKRGMRYSFVEPEHGPEPYQSYYSMPSSKVSKVGTAVPSLSEEERGEILWNINNHVAGLVVQSFNNLLGGHS